MKSMKVCLFSLLPLLASSLLPSLATSREARSPSSSREGRSLPSFSSDAAFLFSLESLDDGFFSAPQGAKAGEQRQRLEKSLLNSFPFNQQGDHHGEHHGEHLGEHGSYGEHGSHGEHHTQRNHGDHGEHGDHGDHGSHGDAAIQPPSASSYSPSLDRSPSSAPLRDRLSDRRGQVNNQVGSQLSNQYSSSSNPLRRRQGVNAGGRGQGAQRPASFPFSSVANMFRQEETDGNNQDNVENSLGDVSENSLDQNSDSFNLIGQAADGEEEGGRKCIDKVMMVEVTEYDEVITCDHSYDKRCHTSYVTNYDSQQEEECEENFKKVCHINYEPLAYNETVQICRTPLVKDCDIPGSTVCQTVYETECATTNKVHEVEDDVTNCRTEQMTKCRDVTVGYVTKPECDEWPVERCTLEKKLVKKATPVTACVKEPRELCAPRGCGFRNGTVECHDKVKTIVVDNPIESCEIEPQRTCKHVTKLVPRLAAMEECVDVPKEICARSKNNPRKVKKPIIKKWCYVPTKESGLQ